MTLLKNPIIRGFHPDPSIIRVGDTYYIATSTFEWFPGVQIHSSKDLENWTLTERPLNDTTKLNMLGNPDSGGIYAPCLSYEDGIFYLVYTDCKNLSGRFWDCSNYLITAPSVHGPWSEPVYLNGRGIDPSLFHDTDGRKWMVQTVLSHKDGGKAGFPKWDGIVIQEYDPAARQLIGPSRVIYRGSGLGTAEGPHLYRRGDRYYLMTAEGGTFYNHAVTMARSAQLFGPYEADPGNPVLTSRDDCTLPLQRAGHGDLVETSDGDWYMVHLCSRPLPSRGRSVMGRETAIQKVYWTEDGWLRLITGENTPQLYVERPEIADSKKVSSYFYDRFDKPGLNIEWQTLRIALPEEMLSLGERPGWLRLKGHESLSSKHYQSFVARRQEDFCYQAETCLEFDPEHFQQMAGLVCFYDTMNHIYLHVSYDDERGRVVSLMINDLNQISYPVPDGIALSGSGPVWLRAEIRYDSAHFYYSEDGNRWNAVGGYVEYSKLSDEYFKERSIERFTGAFVGLCCQDFTGAHIPADFSYFEYKPL